MKKLRVTIEGKAYEVQVEFLDPEPTTSAAPQAGLPGVASSAAVSAAPVALAAPVAAPAPKPAAAGADVVASPLAGKLVAIDVKVGDSVEEGAQVATIEAMKMNTYIYAPKSGRVAEIFARPGDAVEEGAALMRLG